MSNYYKAVVVKASDLPEDVDDWAINQDINDHTDESLLRIPTEYVQTNPLVMWLRDHCGMTLDELESLRGWNGDLYICII